MRLLFRLFLCLSFAVLSLQGGVTMAAGPMSMAGHADHLAAEQSSDSHCHASPKAKCPACMSCCVGCAVPAARLPDFHMPAATASPDAAKDHAMTSFVPATLERPPRGRFV